MNPDRLRESGCVTWQECTCSMERSKENLAESCTALGVEPGSGPWFGGGWHWVCSRGLLGATSRRGGHLWSLSNMTPETSGASRWLCCCKWWCCLDAGWSNEKFSWCQPQTFLGNLGPMLCHVQGNGAVTGWVRKPFSLVSYPHTLCLWCSWGPRSWLSWECFLEIYSGSNEGKCNLTTHFSILSGIGKTKWIVSKKHPDISEVLFESTTIRVLVISFLAVSCFQTFFDWTF